MDRSRVRLASNSKLWALVIVVQHKACSIKISRHTRVTSSQVNNNSAKEMHRLAPRSKPKDHRRYCRTANSTAAIAAALGAERMADMAEAGPNLIASLCSNNSNSKWPIVAYLQCREAQETTQTPSSLTHLY